MKKNIEKIYNPGSFEKNIYKKWNDNGYFKADVNHNKKPYTIVIPPPNVTGQLHMGHALDETLQDILIRFKRMQGYETLWLPGTDHSAIATEVKVVEKLRKEGFSKEQIGREKFLEEAWNWKEKYGNRITGQLKRLGSSCDWTRERFTMDEGCSEAVKEFFVSLYNEGLIYRGERIINWCPKCKTSLSDIEVEHSAEDGSFWHIKYPFADSDRYIEIATTRPETLLGDVAVAVNPNDDRYKNYIGKELILPIVGRKIPVVADDYVDMEFGTGAVKITPAHDPNDFEVGLRHGLEIIDVFTDDAHINEKGGAYAGMERYQARKAIVKELENQGLLIKVEPHSHNVGHCYRCGNVVEPKVSNQWFVKMKKLAQPAIDAVKNNETVFIPGRFDKIYFHWLENIKDWCISRQIWWGHRIPAWYCQDCNKIIVSKTKPTKCTKCSGENLVQDEDTLDTWFSSALWPYSTLGWPDNTDDFKYFYPTNTLVTGYDIIFFWVVRMIFSALKNTGMVPFKHVFIHGLVRDGQGRKMSKSLGNGVDPLEVIDKYGADALRFMLANGTNAGNDMRYTEEKVVAARNFANKLWNASRFILMNIDFDCDLLNLPTDLKIEDKWIISRTNTLVKEITENIENFEISVASQKIYEFIWDVVCDWYIEISKIRLGKDSEDSINVQKVLVYVMSVMLKLLHPFMPFITEEIYSAIPHSDDSIMISNWPRYEERLNFENESDNFEKIIDAVKATRNIRSEMNVPNSRKADIYVETKFIGVFEDCCLILKKLAMSDKIEIMENIDSNLVENCVQVVTDSARIFLPLDNLIDKKKELDRLLKEQEFCKKEIKIFEKKLSNENFLNRAPKHIVEKEQKKLDNIRQKLEKTNKSIEDLK